MAHLGDEWACPVGDRVWQLVVHGLPLAGRTAAVVDCPHADSTYHRDGMEGVCLFVSAAIGCGGWLYPAPIPDGQRDGTSRSFAARLDVAMPDDRLGDRNRNVYHTSVMGRVCHADKGTKKRRSGGSAGWAVARTCGPGLKPYLEYGRSCREQAFSCQNGNLDAGLVGHWTFFGQRDDRIDRVARRLARAALPSPATGSTDADCRYAVFDRFFPCAGSGVAASLSCFRGMAVGIA